MYDHRGQLRFSDSDAMGHVNHARFATLFEDARIGLLRQLAGAGEEVTANGIILARLEIDYLRPLVVEVEPVTVRTAVTHIGTRSFSIDYALLQRREVCARGHSVLVAYDYAAGRSRPLSEAERTQLSAAVETSPGA